MVENKGSLRKPSELYTIENMNSLFHRCEHDKHHDPIDDDVLAIGTADIDEDPVALYLGYYN
jgi:hypothetical protein